MSSRNVVDLRAKRVPARAKSSPASSRPSREQKRMPLRARRRRVRTAFWFAGFLAVCAVIYGVHLVTYLPQFNISDVQVSGVQNFPAELVKRYAESQMFDGSLGYISHSSIFFFNREQMERSIAAEFPRIRSVHISRDGAFSTVMHVEVTERLPFARWCAVADTADVFSVGDVTGYGQCYQMDDTGYIFAVADATTTPASIFAQSYVFSGHIVTGPIGSTFIPGHLPGMLALLSTLQQQDDLTPVSVAVQSPQDFTVTFSEGFSLKTSFGEDANLLARNLKLVLESDSLSEKVQELEYVDLRFGNKVYFKLKGTQE